jgi:hypothetical protein
MPDPPSQAAAARQASNVQCSISEGLMRGGTLYTQ